MSAGHSSSRIWTAIRIVNVRLRFVILMLVVGLIAGNWDRLTNHFDRWTRPGASDDLRRLANDVIELHDDVIELHTRLRPMR